MLFLHIKEEVQNKLVFHNLYKERCILFQYSFDTTRAHVEIAGARAIDSL